MSRCEVCGNDYDRSFEISMAGKSYTFDSFECAVHMLAPRCAHCGCRILGHGLQVGSRFFCCASCARHEGEGEVRDRA